MANYSYDPTNNRGYIPGRYVNKVILLVLMFFLGGFGIHYFYEGKNLGSLSNRVDKTILVKELSSARLLNSFFSCWSK